MNCVDLDCSSLFKLEDKSHTRRHNYKIQKPQGKINQSTFSGQCIIAKMMLK